MKDDVINYYINLKNFYGNYHNHKENAAWAALALYIIFVGLINWVKMPNENPNVIVWVLTVSVTIVFLLTFLHIRTQFILKDIAGAHVMTANVFLNELITQGFNDEEIRSYMIIEESSDTKTQDNHVLPIKFLKKSKVLNTRGRGLLTVSKIVMYSIMFFSSLLVIAVKWLNG